MSSETLKTYRCKLFNAQCQKYGTDLEQMNEQSINKESTINKRKKNLGAKGLTSYGCAYSHRCVFCPRTLANLCTLNKLTCSRTNCLIWKALSKKYQVCVAC